MIEIQGTDILNNLHVTYSLSFLAEKINKYVLILFIIIIFIIIIILYSLYYNDIYFNNNNY